MPSLPCRIREQVITRKGKKYCRKKRSCYCKAIYNNIRQLTRMLLQHKPRNLPAVPKRSNIPVPPKAPVPPKLPLPKSSKKPSAKGHNALLKELKKKIKQIN